MIFFKYIISTIYKGAYKRALRQSVFPDDSVKFRFGLTLSFWICLIIFIMYRILKKCTNLNTNISTNHALLFALTFIILFGILFSVTLNFEWIKNIELTRKQKNTSRIIILLLIAMIILLGYKK